MGRSRTGSFILGLSAATALALALGWPAIWPSSARSESPGYLVGAPNAATTAALHVRLPDKWMPSRGRECARKGKYKNFCQGPRRVPEPHGEAAKLAAKLELGDRKTVSHLLLKEPRADWIAAAGAERGEGLLWPVVGGKLWRGFGKVERGPKRKSRHKGVDIGAAEGTLMRAVKTGLVAYSDNGVRGYGNLLVTVHPDGTVGFYAHAKALYVFPGQRVERGQIVGEVGHTGIARGSHLHFEYRRRGVPRDPVRQFVERPDV